MSNIRTYRVNHAMQMISIPLHSTTNSYHLGNNDEVVDAKGVVQQVTNYYPFGAPYADASATLNPSLQAYKYNGKEFDNMHGLNTYDYGARQYNPITARWDRIDPLCEKFYNVSPYNYCVNNPVNIIDPNGCDTLNISYINGKWIFANPIIAKGNDVFNVTIDGQTSTYTLSEGEWGERVDALNLESNNEYTLGVYHVSGSGSIGTGYYVTPGGPPSTKEGSGARIPEGNYPIIEGKGDKWKKTGVGGKVEDRRIIFHHEVSKDHNPRKSTKGCFVLAYNYSKTKNGTILYDREDSKAASRNFDRLIGGSCHFINRGP